MSVTEWLTSATTLVVAVGVYRLARWYWRPRLRLSREPPPPGGRSDSAAAGREQSACGETDRHRLLSVLVLNTGRRTARRCSARLVLLERFEQGHWRRTAQAAETLVLGWRPREPHESRPTIPARGQAVLELSASDRILGGRYRATIAVIDGDEATATYEFEAGGTRP